jgi:hypothetical protein
MTHLYSFNPRTGNGKLGPMPATMTSRDSCPDACAYKGNGCYAEGGMVRIHWSKLDKGGLSDKQLTAHIRTIKEGAIWRHNVAGDLPQTATGRINKKALASIVSANTGRKGYTYTHHKPDLGSNYAAIKDANAAGFVINLSANTVDQAIQYRRQYPDAPTVTVVPRDYWQGRASVTVSGQTVVRCPAEYRDEIQCTDCGACAVASRKSIIGFTAHGQSVKKAETIANNIIARG